MVWQRDGGEINVGSGQVAGKLALPHPADWIMWVLGPSGDPSSRPNCTACGPVYVSIILLEILQPHWALSWSLLIPVVLQ